MQRYKKKILSHTHTANIYNFLYNKLVHSTIHLETWLFIPNITQKKIQTTQFGCLYFVYNNQKNYALYFSTSSILKLLINA